jgi:hypothetical protein
MELDYEFVTIPLVLSTKALSRFIFFPLLESPLPLLDLPTVHIYTLPQDKNIKFTYDHNNKTVISF